MAQPMIELKEPLISMASKDLYNEEILKSYLDEKYGRKAEVQYSGKVSNYNRSGEGKNSQDKPDEDAPKEEVQEPAESQSQPAFVHELINFHDQMESYCKEGIEKQTHLKKFYAQATAPHEFPVLKMEQIAFQKSNPNIFATIQKASDAFKDIELKEHMCLGDYKKLTKIRIRIYVSVLKMLSKVDTDQDTYKQIKKRLYQIQSLTKYLDLDYSNIYERLHKNLSIHDVPDKIQEEEKKDIPNEDNEEEVKSQTSKKSKKSEKSKKSQNGDDEEEKEDEDGEEKEDKEDEENEEKSEEKESEKADSEDKEDEDESDDEDDDDDDDDEEEEEYYEEDDEIEDLFYQSNIGQNREGFSHELEREELKWEKRAEWLEEMITKIKDNPKFACWGAWFQAKLEQLADFDVPIKSAEEQELSSIFYLHKYMDEQMKKFDPRTEYSADQKVYPDVNTDYPTIRYDQQSYVNSEYYPCLKAWVCIREKLCSRVINKENQTDYFLTVFERKPFGNEKIYEKRINLRHHEISTIDNFIIHPNGGHILFEFVISGFSTRISLIFNLNAQHKDPQLLKKESHSLGFFDKFYYCLREHTQEVKQQDDKKQTAKGDEEIEMVIDGETNDPDKAKTKGDDQEVEEEQSKDTETFWRLYEYDLNDYTKIKYSNLKHLQDFDPNSTTDTFARYKDGFYYSRQKQDAEKKNFNFEITLKTDVYSMELSDKIDNSQQEKVKITVNEKGDRALLSYWKEKTLTFQRYILDPKDKKIKRDVEIKLKQDIVLEETKVSELIIPLYSDFLILLKPSTGDQTFVFLNENPIASARFDPSHFQINHNEKGLQSLFINESNEATNLIKYQICEQLVDKEKKEWIWRPVSHDIINRQYVMQFPYAAYIYNHDQVIMKDLTKENLKGYYYMNSFLGIKKGSRPLTIWAVAYSNKYNFSVPVIDSNYTNMELNLKVHQLKTCHEKNSMFKIQGLTRLRIYQYNQDFFSFLNQWSGVTDSKNRLVSDIKVSFKYNQLSIEQWERNNCVNRLIVTYFHVSIPQEEMPNVTYDDDLKYRPNGTWLFIQQKNEGSQSNISIYTRRMLRNFYFSDLVQLESCWDYQDDEQGNQIYNILIDTLPKDKIDLYIVYNNCTIRKFTSPITSSELQFEESQTLINLEYLFKGKGKEGAQADKGAAGGAGKRTNLHDQFRGDIFIANSVFYSQNGFVDLNSNNIQDKYLVGCQIRCEHFKYVEKAIKILYSNNEARFGVIHDRSEIYYSESSRQSVILFVAPLLNSRQLPLFDHRRFKHPIVPVVHKENGCVSVFSLHTSCIEMSYEPIKSHQNQTKNIYFKLYNTNPGLIIKYFNGIEQVIPMYKFGEKFEEIIRFKQSNDGRYVTLTGVRLGLLEDRFYNQKLIKNDKNTGIFLYEVSVNSMKLIKAILFAQKDQSTIVNDEKRKLNLPTKFIREYVEPEIEGNMVGEYDNDYVSSDGAYDYFSFEDKIDFAQVDDDYVEMLKKKKEEERILKEKQEALQKKKTGRFSQKITVTTPSPAQRNNRASMRENLLSNSQHSNNDEENDGFHKNSNDGLFAQIEQHEENQEEVQEQGPAEFADIPRINQNLVQIFNGFDIPYLPKYAYGEQQVIQNGYKRNLIREVENENYNPENEGLLYEEDKKFVELLSSEESSLIERMHKNILFDVNDNGHMLLVNRFKNTVYFFYECLGEYKLLKAKLDPTKAIYSVDSSKEYLVITYKEYEPADSYDCKYRYIVYDIEQMINCTKHDEKWDISRLKVAFDSKTYETFQVKKDVIGLDEYKYDITDCKINKHLLILRIKDHKGVTYLKVYDIKQGILIYYIEGEKFLISGDKKFIWQIENNMVFDIENGLSTLFIWPGEQINTHSYHHLDLFNVSSDRTLMTTQGYLQLAFNMISYQIDEDLSELDWKNQQTILNKCNNLKYLCYKISDYKSIMERIFIEDYDKLSLKDYLNSDYDYEQAVSERDALTQEQKEKKLFDQQISQNKGMQNLLAFIVNKYDAETEDPANITNFFFSFYSIQEIENEKTKVKTLRYSNIFQKMFSLFNDKRVDLIEDILHYVVESKNVPILQHVINSCFCEFLKIVTSSQAFQNYLNNITLQTTEMKDVEKFQITSNDLGFFAESHESPILDDRFYMKFRVPKETKKDCEVFYISLGNLLIDHGKDVMDMLSDKKYLPIMDIPFIKYLVMYQWQQVKYTIHKKLLYPFFVMLALFNVFVLQIDFHNEPAEVSQLLNVLQYIYSVILLFVLGYFFYVEAIQFIKQPGDYLKSFWNVTDLLSYSMCILVVLLDRFGSNNAINRPIASVCLIVLWIKLFYFLRVFESTSRLIRMIIEIVNDMTNFLIVLSIGIVGFSGGFYILQQGLNEEVDGVLPGNVLQSVIYSYRLAQGDFQLDFFDSLYGADYILAWFLFIVGSLFLVIVLLNLLIAIMGDTFSRVLEQITNLSVREKVMLVAENESLFNRNALFKSAQFLIIINEKNLDSVQADNWDGQINALKRQVLEKVSTLQTTLDTKITENQKDLKKRMIDQDERSKKQTMAQETRISGAFKNEFSEMITKINEQFQTQQTTFKNSQHQTVRMLQDQLEQLKTEQTRLTSFVHQSIQSNKKVQDEEDDE